MPIKGAPDTTAKLTLPDVAGPVVVPTTVLSRTEAELLRDYKVFLEARGLTEALYCPDCVPGQIDGVTIRLNENQLAIACLHRLLFYQGPFAPAHRFDEMLQAQAQGRMLEPDKPLWVLSAEPEDESLFRAEAQLLRSYRAFLVKHHVREALTCTACWANGLPDGCRAFVTPDHIQILCRHRRLTFKGQTI